MSQLSFDVIKRVWPKSGLTTFLKSTPEIEYWDQKHVKPVLFRYLENIFIYSFIS